MTFCRQIVATAIGAFFGAATAFLLNYCATHPPVSVHARPINYTANQHTSFKGLTLKAKHETLWGTRYFIRLAVVALNQEFPVKACTVVVKYPGMQVPLVGRLYRHYRDLYSLGPDIGEKKLNMPWGAPGLMDSHDGECTMKPEVSIGHYREEAAEVLYA